MPRFRPAYGRSLTDFGFLWPQEKRLLAKVRRGEELVIGDTRPKIFDRAENGLRGSFIRFLALGGDEHAAIHEAGLNVVGGWICGDVNIDGAKAQRIIILSKCVVDGFTANYAEIGVLSLDGSLLSTGLRAQRLKCSGDVFLRENFEAKAPVILTGATINGDLDCTRGKFTNPWAGSKENDRAAIEDLIADLAASDTRSANCMNTVRSTEELQKLAENFLRDGKDRLMDFTRETPALELYSVRIGNNCLLRPSCVRGITDISYSNISNALDLGDGQFKGNVYAYRSCVTGPMVFGNCKISGGLDFRGARCDTLRDNIDSWPYENTHLAGFVYERFGPNTETNENKRKCWLMRQPKQDVGEDAFKDQPWDQLIISLKASGHPNRARKIAIFKEEEKFKSKKYKGVGGLFYRYIYGSFSGFGHEPERIFWILSVLIITSLAIFGLAVRPTLQPWSSKHYYLAPAKLEAPCQPTANQPCPPPKPPAYEDFVLMIYTLETLVPIVRLGVASEWKPVVRDERGNILCFGWVVQWLVWIDIAFGWIASGLFAYILGKAFRSS